MHILNVAGKWWKLLYVHLSRWLVEKKNIYMETGPLLPIRMRTEQITH
jgi:hypothetical protein